MAASNPKEVLRKEKDLLRRLADTAQKFVQELAADDDQVAALGNNWKKYFESWSDLDEALIKMNDGDRDTELKKEIARLKKFRETLTGDDDAVRFYRDKVFKPDIADAEDVLTQP